MKKQVKRGLIILLIVVVLVIAIFIINKTILGKYYWWEQRGCSDENGVWHDDWQMKTLYYDCDSDGYGWDGNSKTWSCSFRMPEYGRDYWGMPLVSKCVGTNFSMPKGYSDKFGDCDDSNKDKWQVKNIYPDKDGDGWYGVGEWVCVGNSTPENYQTEEYIREWLKGVGKVWGLSFEYYDPLGLFPELLVADCNDNNPEIRPRAEEKCNKIDDNCDGAVDKVVVISNFQGYFQGPREMRGEYGGEGDVMRFNKDTAGLDICKDGEWQNFDVKSVKPGEKVRGIIYGEAKRITPEIEEFLKSQDVWDKLENKETIKIIRAVIFYTHPETYGVGIEGILSSIGFGLWFDFDASANMANMEWRPWDLEFGCEIDARVPLAEGTVSLKPWKCVRMIVWEKTTKKLINLIQYFNE